MRRKGKVNGEDDRLSLEIETWRENKKAKEKSQVFPKCEFQPSSEIENANVEMKNGALEDRNAVFDFEICGYWCRFRPVSEPNLAEARS